MRDGGRALSATLLLVFCIASCLQEPVLSQSTFQSLFQVQWSSSHVVSQDNGQQVQLVLDQSSGAAFQSIHYYTYGHFSVNMKLIPGNSAGTVTAIFLSSSGDKHDEIDFEFLGNSSGQPYILQTNLFANGVGNREQRFYLWFDPVANFHTYSIIWNHAQILYLVDNTVIRVFKNLESRGVAYPSYQPSQLLAALFEASSWATRGGQVPINWNAAPFVATYSNFVIDACVNEATMSSGCASTYQNNWWEGSAYTTMSTGEINQLQYIREKYLVYDYCTDSARNPTPPLECSYNYSP